MQFRIRDLLLVTGLLAVWLTAALYAANALAPGDLAKESPGAIAVFLLQLAVYEFCYQFFRRTSGPYEFSFAVLPPWKVLFSGMAALVGLAMFASRLADGVFFVASTLYSTFAILLLVHRRAYIKAEGVFYPACLISWSLLHLKRSPMETVSVHLGPPFLGLSLEVPGEHTKAVVEFATASKAPNSEL